MPALTLAQFPEELLERIFALCLSNPHPQRPAWLRSPTQRPSTRLAPLLTSHQLARICTPLLYHTIHLSSPAQSHLLLRTLTDDAPALATHVRCLSVAGVWRDASEVMSVCAGGVKVLDVSIMFDDEDGDVVGLWGEAVRGMRGVRHLTLRKPNNVYLSLPRPRSVINALAIAIAEGWSDLQTVNIAFKLSDDTPTSPVFSPTPSFLPFSLSAPIPTHTTTSTTTTTTKSITGGGGGGPITRLTHALASAPALHTFATHLPSVWNVAILAVSANPALERIVLYSANTNAGPMSPFDAYDPSCPSYPHVSPHPSNTNTNTNTHTNTNTNTYPSPHPSHPSNPSSHTYASPPASGIIGTGLFLMEARKHARLGELIRAGTPILRTRARTMGTESPSPRAGMGMGMGTRGEGVGVGEGDKESKEGEGVVGVGVGLGIVGVGEV